MLLNGILAVKMKAIITQLGKFYQKMFKIFKKVIQKIAYANKNNSKLYIKIKRKIMDAQILYANYIFLHMIKQNQMLYNKKAKTKNSIKIKKNTQNNLLMILIL